MKTTFFAASLMAVIGAMATTVPTQMGIEVVRGENGAITMVREVPRSLTARACTNCVHVGDHCTIGEGNCYATENASCTDCGDVGTICVDTQGGSCSAP